MLIEKEPLCRFEYSLWRARANKQLVGWWFLLPILLLIMGMYHPVSATEILMVEKNGVFTVPVKINGVLELQFIVDSGTAEVQIPADVILTLTRTGTIAPADFVSEPTEQATDQSAMPSKRLIIHRLELADHRIENVPATVGPPQGRLILGQAALKRLPAWAIDNEQHVLMIKDSHPTSSKLPTGEENPITDIPIDVTANPDKPTVSNKDSSVEAPNIKQGYTYIFESIYPDDPQRNKTTERRVVAVDNGKITVATRNLKTDYVRTLEFTTEWNFISSMDPKGGGSTFQPPLKYFEFPLYPGKTWKQTSIETNRKSGVITESVISATVGDWEDITVPAGTFRTIKITAETTELNRETGLKSTGVDVSWYAPKVGRSVKSSITSRDFSGNQERQIIQLINSNIGLTGN